MAYGTLKVDNITYTSAGVDATTTVSGLVEGNFPNMTITGTISGATITGNTGQFTTITAVTGIFTNTLSGAVVTAPSASAASPSFVFTGDADTGLYSPGANQVAISTSGTGRLFINESGRVAIGGNSFGAKLDISSLGSGPLPAAIFRADAGTGNSGGLILANSSTDTNERDWYLVSNSVSYGDFAIRQGASQGADPVTTGSNRFYIDINGNIGVGTTTPNVTGFGSTVTTINVAAGNNGGLELTKNNVAAGHFTVESAASNDIRVGAVGGSAALTFQTAGNERGRFDSSGRFLIGTSSARSNFFNSTVSAALQVEGTGNDSSSLSIIRNSNDVGRAILTLAKTRGTTVGSTTIVQNNDLIGSVEFQGSDGTEFVQAAAIECQVDGTPGANDMPGRLVLSSTPSGSASPVERMRISQNGVVTIQNGAVAVIDVLADGATITPDLASGCNFSVSISGNRTLANPTNITAGQTGSIFITQGTGSNTLSWGSYWDFPGGTAPTLSTASGAVDRVDYIVRTTTSIQTVFTANYS